MVIQINQGHISQTATRQEAERFILELAKYGYAAEYHDGPDALWDFDSYDQLNDFERSFEDLRDLLWPPYIWQVKYPCDCGSLWRGHPCKCGDKPDEVTQVIFMDYYQSLEKDRQEEKNAAN